MSAAFAAELKAADFSSDGFRAATFEEKQNVDADTLIIVLKALGEGVPALFAFFLFVRTILRRRRDKPSVRMTYNGRTVELHGAASDKDVRRLCDVLIGSK